MTIHRTFRTGKTYYLHAGVTKTGKPKHFFSLKQDGKLADTIPDGFEVHENVNGQVFLRKIPKPIITPKELELVVSALREYGEVWEYQVEVKKNTITVYESGTDIDGISDMLMTYVGRALTADEKLQRTNYMAVMRFVLEDKEARLFVTERFCFKGRIDDWIFVDGPSPLADQVDKYVKHLGQNSFYDLF
jgi:hypothetical protein